MNRNHQQKSYYYIVRNAILLLISALVLLQGVLIFPFIKRQTEDLYYTYHLNTVQNIRNDVYLLYESLNDMALKISMDYVLVDCFFDVPQVSNKEILDKLKNYTAIHNVDSIYLYNNTSGMIFSSTGEISQKANFRDQNVFEHINRKLDPKLGYIFLTFRTATQTHPADPSKTFFSLIFYPNADLSTAVVINVRPNYLTDLLRKYNLLSTGDFLIYDNDGKIIFGGKRFDTHASIIDTPFYIPSGTIASEAVKINNELRFVASVFDERLKYTFVWFVPKPSLFTQGIANSSFIIFPLMLAVLLLGILITIVMSKRLSNPIRDVMSKLQTIESKADKNRESLIRSVFTQPSKTVDTEELIRIAPIFAEDNLVLIKATIDYSERFCAEYTLPDRELFFYGMANICAELFEQNGAQVISDPPTGILIITRNSSAIRDILSVCQEKLQEYLYSTVSFIVSEPFTLNSASKAYETVNLHLRYRFISGNNTIIFPEDTAHDIENESFSKTLKLLGSQIFAQDFQGFTEELKKAGEDIRRLEPLQARLFYVQAAFVLSEAAFMFREDDKESFLYAVIKAETIDEAESTLLSAVTHFMNNEKQPLYTKADDIASKALLIIQTEYGNDNLNANMIANRLNISLPYLSKLFNERNNIKLVNYITKVRLQKAQTLLAESELSITEIAQEVGFVSADYFAKCFKKHCGTSPSQYRASFMK